MTAAADERGAASVLACLALVGLIGLTLLAGQVGVVVVARHRVQAAVDAAALAAAGALVEGTVAACAVAEEAGRRMAVRIERCEVRDWDVVIEGVMPVPLGVFGHKAVYGVARAGPVEEVTDE